MTTVDETTWHVERPGGRRVAVHELTPDVPAGAPVVLLCHAAPGSGAFDPDPDATAARGVRLLGLDRPGYGGSDPVRDGFATVDAAAEDAAAVLGTVLAGGADARSADAALGADARSAGAALGADARSADAPLGATAGVAGWSAGGRVALALAARHPDLVARVAVIATPAPDEEVPWIPEENRAGIDALRGAPPEAAHAALTEAFGPVLGLAGDDRFGLVGIGEADTAALARPGVRERLGAMLDAAFVQGGAGMVADIAGYTLQRWGFAPEAVTAPVLLVYGDADPVAGPAHGEWWRRALPDARLETRPGTGHLVVAPAWDRVLSHLTPPH
ncbi:MAG TPA: alpha/beta hydrolase-fold protein [Pseudonocardia sp.]|nr:alpha/beta hydrolase-fold protein [Pseudonocardia sp.]